MEAFAKLKNEFWYMDLAYVRKLAKDNKGVKYLLFRQGMSDRTADAKWLQKKDSTETVCALLTLITKTNRPTKIWVDKGTEFAAEFGKKCKAERTQIKSTMSPTKAAFAESKIRILKNTIYLYMEDYGYK